MENNELKPGLNDDQPEKKDAFVEETKEKTDVASEPVEKPTDEAAAAVSADETDLQDDVIKPELDQTATVDAALPEEVKSESEVKDDADEEVAPTLTKSDSGADMESAVTEKKSESHTDSNAAEEVKVPAVEIDAIDHDQLDKSGLVRRLNYFLQNIDISSSELRDEVEAIKNSFYKQHKKEVQEIRDRFLQDGGDEKDFRVAPDPQESLLKDMLNAYREQRLAAHRKMEEQKTANLALKYEIIEEIKSLEQGEESLNQTFKVFRDLQDRWRNSGPVPQANVKGLYETYHHHVERFYDYIKINKDLRDLDLKKNSEAKLKLCERAEGLNELENVLDAFAELQELHNEWREVGPVHKDEKEPLWERFKEATAQINRKHQDHYEEIKKGQKENLDKKTALCEKVEAIAEGSYDKPKVWNQKSDEILSIQKEWRTIGFAPKKYNTKIYERFRAGCDVFFNKKRDYYQHYKDIQDQNYEQKLKLVELAESLRGSTNWKKDSDTLIRIQKEWKQVGPVPRKHSDAIWKRFRGACDDFFNRKSAYFKNIDSVYEENLAKKKEIIAKVKAFKVGKDDKEALAQFETFKQEWNEIGHVPFKEKDAIYNEFRNALNAHYDNLNMDDMHKEVERFKSKIDDMQQAPNSYDKVSTERQRLFNKLKKLESEIATLENNIGFFSNSSKSESLLKDFERKIVEAKERAKVIEQKINLLDKI